MENPQFARAMELRNQILRGDMMIGILPLSAADDMVAAFRQAGEAGMAEAWLELGRCQAQGIGPDAIAADPEAAVDSFRRAADAGLREGALAFARHAYFELRDPALADETGRRAKALLTDDSDGKAHLLCGYLAFAGYGLPKDAAESLRLHREAAARGNADAMFEIYVMQSTGQGTAKDEAAALEWCKKAADQGQARACYNLGAFYATGRGVEKDPAQSIAWYEKASEAGHARASATVGYMYLVGDGVEADEKRAAEFFDTADEQGFDVDDFLDQLGVERPA